MKGKINGILGYSSCTFSTYFTEERQIKNEHHIKLDTVFTPKTILD